MLRLADPAQQAQRDGRQFDVVGSATAVDDAVSLLDPGSPGRERLAETRDFFAFMMDDMTGMLERWQEHRAAGPGSAPRV